MTTLTFQNTTLSVINQNNKTFINANDLGKALEYANPEASIRKIYNSNVDEFTPEMTALVEMQTAGGKQQVRIFSLRGAHLIAMFARTPVAKDFRKWVLDILDKEISQNQPQIAPLEKEFHHFRSVEDDLTLVSMWFALHKCLETLQQLEKPLNALGSHFGSLAYTQATEYRHTLDFARKVLLPMTDDIEVNAWQEPHYYRALSTLRGEKPTAKRAVGF